MFKILSGDYGNPPDVVQFNWFGDKELDISVSDEILKNLKEFNNKNKNWITTSDVLKSRDDVKRIELIKKVDYEIDGSVVFHNRRNGRLDTYSYYASDDEFLFLVETRVGNSFIAKASKKDFNIFIEVFDSVEEKQEEKITIEEEKKGEVIQDQNLININDPWDESIKNSEIENSNERKIESCKFGSLEEIDQIYELKCLGQLNFKDLNITSFQNLQDLSEYNIKLNSAKLIRFETDYLELIRFLKRDVTQSKYEYTKEIGKLLSICAKYNCKVLFSPELSDSDGNVFGGCLARNENNFSYIIIEIPEDKEGYIAESQSAKWFLKTLRHEVFHLIQFVYKFGVLGIDIFDEVTLEVFDSTIYKNNSIEELICEFEAHSADKVPFMTCDIDSHLSEFSNIEGTKYAATPTRIETIELIAKERRIPSYTKKDKSIFLEEKKVEKLFQEELDNTQKEEQRLEKQNEWINKRVKKERVIEKRNRVIEKRNRDQYLFKNNISQKKINEFTFWMIFVAIFTVLVGDVAIQNFDDLRAYIVVWCICWFVLVVIFSQMDLFKKG